MSIKSSGRKMDAISKKMKFYNPLDRRFEYLQVTTKILSSYPNYSKVNEEKLKKMRSFAPSNSKTEHFRSKSLRKINIFACSIS